MQRRIRTTGIQKWSTNREQLSARSAGLLLFMVALCVWNAHSGCGSGDRPLRQEEVELGTEVIFQGEPDVVRVDSVSWQLGTLNTTIPDEPEIEGLFQIEFSSITDDSTSIRYELRFLDADSGLIDIFFPFGQPVDLRGGERHTAAGSFFIRLGDPLDLPLVKIMRVVLDVTRF